MNNKELQAETEAQQSKNAELLPSAPLVASPLLPAVPIDGEGQRLHEGDRVYTYDAFAANHTRIYGTLYKNSEYPEVSEWYVDYDDANQCAVLDFGLLWKA